MNYWDNRYKNGGTSGQGSIGELRSWKWNIIKKYNGIRESVIDIGCGDMSFWENNKLPLNYIGIDFSDVIIQKNIKKYPKSQFYTKSSASTPLHICADTVICFDMLFHIMNDSDYIQTLQNICTYSNNQIFIYTWIINPLPKKWIFFETLSDTYEKYYNPIIILKIILNNGFILKNLETNNIDKYGAMFIFEKECS